MKTILCFALLFFNCSNSVSNDQKENATYKVVIMPSETSASTMDAELMDLNEDGLQDLILAMEWRRNIAMLNNGDGTFTPKTDLFTNINNDSEDIAIADYDMDGDLDIVFVSEDNQQHEYYMNNGDGTFTDNSSQYPVKKTTNGVDVGDIDNDGDMDLILGNAGQNTLLINDGNGNFTDKTTEWLPESNETTQDVEFGDIDNDGDLDILVGNETENFIYINEGIRKMRKMPLPSVNQDIEETREADFGDIDGDGDLDIFIANVVFNPPTGKTFKNRFLINDGIGNFTDASQKFLGPNESHSVDADFYDLDSDGDLDLIIANAFGGTHQIMINSKGNFEDKTKNYFSESLTNGIDVVVHDFNQDGYQDIYFTVFQGRDQLILSQK